eukprot:9565656-Prorocentrum_lima.AAC.1
MVSTVFQDDKATSGGQDTEYAALLAIGRELPAAAQPMPDSPEGDHQPSFDDKGLFDLPPLYKTGPGTVREDSVTIPETPTKGMMTKRRLGQLGAA